MACWATGRVAQGRTPPWCEPSDQGQRPGVRQLEKDSRISPGLATVAIQFDFFLSSQHPWLLSSRLPHGTGWLPGLQPSPPHSEGKIEASTGSASFRSPPGRPWDLSAYTLLARRESHGHILLQGRLGNVAVQMPEALLWAGGEGGA